MTTLAEMTDYRQVISAAAGFIGLADFFGEEKTKSGTITDIEVSEVSDWRNSEVFKPCVLVEIDGVKIKAPNSLLQGLHRELKTPTMREWVDCYVELVRSTNRNGTISVDLLSATRP